MIGQIKIGDNWKCPYCGHAQVITHDRVTTELERLYVKGWNEGPAGYFIAAIVCANSECAKLSLDFHLTILTSADFSVTGKIDRVFDYWQLLPVSSAKPQPDYIPEPIRRDYEEACAIRDLSPKASATLTRRCIQGIIRDFCGISKSRLIDEIRELRRLVDEGESPKGVQADTVNAIDHVRSIGNIGAHMESDINVIVDVDPNEAQVLIELVELLFTEWYIAKHDRTQRLDKLRSIAETKTSQKNLPPPNKDDDDGD